MILQTKRLLFVIRVDALEEEMHKRDYNCEKLYSDILQSKRERIMKSFSNGDIQYLIAIDVAARGLDFAILKKMDLFLNTAI